MVAGKVNTFLWCFLIIFILTKSFHWCTIVSINGEQAALFSNMDSKCGALRGSILNGDGILTI